MKLDSSYADFTKDYALVIAKFSGTSKNLMIYADRFDVFGHGKV